MNAAEREAQLARAIELAVAAAPPFSDRQKIELAKILEAGYTGDSISLTADDPRPGPSPESDQRP